MDTLAQLQLAVTALEGKTSVHAGNVNEAGLWKRMAEALEQGAGVTNTRNPTVEGYMERSALAAEAKWGGSGAEENKTQEGLIKRIVDALEISGGVKTGSYGNRLRLGASNAVFAATLLTPANWDFIAFGDSRTENGVAATLTAGGYGPSTKNLGPVGWLGAETGHRLRPGLYPNFGISASNTTQGAAVPRQSAVSTVVNSSPQTWYRGADSQNKGTDYAAAHNAGIIVFLYGTNDSDFAVTTRTNVTTMLNAFGSSKLIILLNETPEGYASDGTAGTGSSASSQAFKDLSDWFKTLDYASGHANARSNVVVVDSWATIVDTAASVPGTSWVNKVGTLRDGLHYTPYGARLLAQAIHTRLTAAFGSTYTSLPAQYSLPTANGLVTPANVAPFVHTNPILTPGTNGSVLGSYATAPLAANVPQGWWISSTGTTAGLSVVCDKTGTDSDGYPKWRITVSGTLANSSSCTLTMYQNAIATGQLATTDKVRVVGRLALAAGSQGLQSAYLEAAINLGAATALDAFANVGSPGGGSDRIGYNLAESTYEAGGFDHFYLTELLDLQNPNMAVGAGGPGNITSITSAIARVGLQFQNFTGASRNISAQLDISRCGMFRTSS